MVTQVTQIPSPPEPRDQPAVFNQKASDVFAGLYLAIPQMNAQADENNAAAVTAGQSASRATGQADAALGYRNEANAAKVAAQEFAGTALGAKTASEQARDDAARYAAAIQPDELKNRANHTGKQATSTVEGLDTWLSNLANRQLAFGDQQTRKTVSKATGITYTNTTGRTIEVGVTGVTNSSVSYVAVSVAGKFRGASWTPQAGATVAASALVLPDETYMFAGGPQGTPPAMEFWEIS